MPIGNTLILTDKGIVKMGDLSPVKNSDLYKGDKVVCNIFSYLDSISDLFIFDKVEEINKGRKKSICGYY